MFIQSRRLKDMAKRLPREPIRERWNMVAVWNRWFLRYDQVLDRYSIALAPIAFMILLVSIPIKCCALYLTLSLKSQPLMRLVAFGILMIITVFNSLAILTLSLVGEWVDELYNPLSFALPGLKPKTESQLRVKLQLALWVDAIGREQIGVCCYIDIVVVDVRFSN